MSEDGRRLNLPNALSAVRVLLVPAFAGALLEGRAYAALGLFLLAGITDGLDGFAARRLDQRTQLGTYLDPLADKLLSITAYVLLAHLGVLPVWLAVLVVARDAMLLVSPLVYLTLHRERLEVRVSWLGKANTVLQIATVGMALLVAQAGGWPWLASVLDALVIATAASILASGAHYLHRDRHLFHRNR